MTPDEIIYRARKRGMKMKHLLEQAGIDHSTWWRWRKCKFQPRKASIDKIKRILNQPTK